MDDYLNVGAFLAREEKEGRNSLDMYEDFAAKSKSIVNDLKERVKVYKDKGYLTVGYGAAAKANTLLNFGKINLDFIIDDNPLKQGLFTPGMNIPIKGSDSLSVDDKMLIVPLAWNFYDEIKSRVEKKRDNPNDVFIKYFPELSICHASSQVKFN